MKVKKHTTIWYSLDIEIEERKNLFDTLSQWGIISQLNVCIYWKRFENNKFELFDIDECDERVDIAFRRAIDIKENLLRSWELDHSINEDVIENAYNLISQQLKDLTDDHYKIQNIFKDIRANIILKQME
tara:strand:- start:3043 stop:3432 length:390 start_codon:yes stop_codon:yes gene_type:complete